jgi:transposase
MGQPATHDHEYFRGGTAKLLTLFRPATGEVRALPVTQTTNAVLHPWMKSELTEILAPAPTQPEVPPCESVESALVPAVPPPLQCPEPKGPDFWQQWTTWGWTPERLAEFTHQAAQCIVLLLVLDNLKGHHTKEFVAWCLERGIALLYTPLGGSWLNMAEAIQRILIHRAVNGQHYSSAAAIMDALKAVVHGWNRAPTPFLWGGKRRERRRRAKERRHTIGGARVYTRQPITYRRMKQLLACGNGSCHDK